MARWISWPTSPLEADEIEALMARTKTRQTLDERHACDAIQVIDSHTGGEPTRVIIAGGPDLGARHAWRSGSPRFRDAAR